MSNMDNIDEITYSIYTVEWFNYITVVVSYLATIGTIIIFAVMSFMLILDTMYLTFPPFKAAWDEYRNSNGGKLASRTVKRFLVSKNAFEAFEDAANTNQPVMWCYLKRAFKIYIIAGVLIVILVAGTDLIINAILRLISGALNAIGD